MIPGGSDATIKIRASDDTAAGFSSVEMRAKQAAQRSAGEFRAMTQAAQQQAGSFGGVVGQIAAGFGPMALAATATFSVVRASVTALFDEWRLGAEHARESVKALVAAERMAADAVMAAAKARTQGADAQAGRIEDPLRALVAAGGDQAVQAAQTFAEQSGQTFAQVGNLWAQGRRGGFRDDQIGALLTAAQALADAGRMRFDAAAEAGLGLGAAAFDRLAGGDPVRTQAALLQAKDYAAFADPAAAGTRSAQAAAELAAAQEAEDRRFQRAKDEIDARMPQADLGRKQQALERLYGSTRPRQLQAGPESAFALDQGLVDQLAAEQFNTQTSSTLWQLDERRRRQAEIDARKTQDAIDMGAVEAYREAALDRQERAMPGFQELFTHQQRLLREREHLTRRNLEAHRRHEDDKVGWGPVFGLLADGADWSGGFLGGLWGQGNMKEAKETREDIIRLDRQIDAVNEQIQRLNPNRVVQVEVINLPQPAQAGD